MTQSTPYKTFVTAVRDALTEHDRRLGRIRRGPFMDLVTRAGGEYGEACAARERVQAEKAYDRDEAQIASLQRELEAAGQMHEDTQRSLTLARAERDGARKAAEDLRIELAGVRDVRDKLLLDVKAADGLIDRLRNELAEAQAELAKTDTAGQEIVDRLTAGQAELAAERDRLDVAGKHLRGKIAILEAERDQLRAKVAAYAADELTRLGEELEKGETPAPEPPPVSATPAPRKRSGSSTGTRKGAAAKGDPEPGKA